MYLQSIKSVKHNALKSVNRSIFKKSRYLELGVFIVHSSMSSIYTYISLRVKLTKRKPTPTIIYPPPPVPPPPPFLPLPPPPPPIFSLPCRAMKETGCKTEEKQEAWEGRKRGKRGNSNDFLNLAKMWSLYFLSQLHAPILKTQSVWDL